MWGKPLITISDNCALDVQNLKAMREWYGKSLALRDSREKRQDDSGRPFADLLVSDGGALLTLLELAPGSRPERQHVIFFAKNLEKAQQWLAGRGVLVEPITNDSGGNRLFRFQDLEGNSIEVCVEP